MKLNWGHGVVLAFFAFMAFIVYFLVIATVDEKYNHELVAEDYYKQELEYQNVIDVKNKTQKADMQVEISIEKGRGISFVFPTQTNGELKEGEVKFYRPSDSKRDFRLPISLIESKLLVPNELLLTGRWYIDLDYKVRNEYYKTSFKISY